MGKKVISWTGDEMGIDINPEEVTLQVGSQIVTEAELGLGLESEGINDEESSDIQQALNNKVIELEDKKFAEFRAHMFKAFLHGHRFQFLGIEGDMPEDCAEENLPFSEWFAKNYQ